jgi:hypothetical protein
MTGALMHASLDHMRSQNSAADHRIQRNTQLVCLSIQIVRLCKVQPQVGRLSKQAALWAAHCYEPVQHRIKSSIQDDSVSVSCASLCQPLTCWRFLLRPFPPRCRFLGAAGLGSSRSLAACLRRQAVRHGVGSLVTQVAGRLPQVSFGRWSSNIANSFACLQPLLVETELLHLHAGRKH